MTRLLHIWLDGHRVGELRQAASGQMRFRYLAEWVERPDALALSRSLPLRKEPFPPREARPFFAGLLPEETNRELVARVLAVSKDNDFALLNRIGGECAGAVSILPEGEQPAAGGAAYQPLDAGGLAALLKELPKRPLLAGEKGLRLSLAGSQTKMALARIGTDYALPLNGAPSTHILKPPSAHFAALVENECFCMKLAAAAGLSVASVELKRGGDTPFLEVERYDRQLLPNGEIHRLHQEDFCQALGIPPELKYQTEGGPNLQHCFELIRSASSVPALDLLQLFDAVVFNFLIGNGDAHGKNFSLLYGPSGREVRLAPLYDLVCTQAYPELSRNMAMKLGGERDPQRIGLKHWGKFAQDTGLSPAAALRRVQTLARRVRGTLAGLVPAFEGATAAPAVVRENCERLLSLPS